MKKTISVLLSILLLAALFTGCGKTEKSGRSASIEREGTLKIVTTIFPVYDWTREIVGENIENVDLTLLLKNGVDLHSYQPSSAELVAIADADVFVYVGGHSDAWVADALKNESNPDRITINLFEVLGDTLKPLVLSEGMEHHHDDNHDDHNHHHDEESDEHIWLSLARAKASVHALADQFAKADPAHAEIYQANARNYETKLDALDQEYRIASISGHTDTLLFADRFPFFYMADDYGLNYYAAFTGCSAESEASVETVTFLAQKMDELGLKNVLTIENRTHKIPETIIESTKTKNQNILIMNSLQSVTEKQIMEGMTYLDAMKSNLDVLKTALQ